ncbi:MAG: DUF4097 family beta strand repeat-containing protein [Planctomycetota bacterium]|nr:DUF4097 family beta strand repeat-containing protein [Planctomycetota bacterium]
MPQHRNSSLPLLLSLLSAIAAATGCSTRAKPDLQPLELEGPVSVHVESFAGDVTIKAVRGPSSVTVEGEALHAINRTTDAETALDSIRWTTELDNDDRGPRLVVRVQSDSDETHLLRAHVTVRVPIADGIHVRTRRGDVLIDEVTGPVDVRTTDGWIELLSNQPLRDPISLFTNDGDVNVRIAPGSCGTFDLHADHGSSRVNVKSGQLIVRGHSSEEVFNGTLNDGTNPITIRTTDGSIRFVVKPNPKQHGLFHIP